MLFKQFYRVCSLRWLMKITFTVHLFRCCSALEWKPTTSEKDADCPYLSLKTNNSQQNGESELFLHQAHYTGQSLVLDLDFPVLQTPPKSPVIWHSMLPVLHVVLRSASLKFSILALKYISVLSSSSNLYCLLVGSFFELHGLGTLPLSSPEVRDHLESWNHLVNHSSLLFTSESEHCELLWNSPHHTSLCIKGNEQLTLLIHFLKSVLPKAKWQCSLVNQGKIYFDTRSFFRQRAFYSFMTSDPFE